MYFSDKNITQKYYFKYLCFETSFEDRDIKMENESVISLRIFRLHGILNEIINFHSVVLMDCKEFFIV